MTFSKSMQEETYDYVVIGSGFGGSVSAMRLVEKGYSVLILERGKRFEDQDFPKTNWNIFRYLWAPALRCFGILQLTPFKNVFVLHGSGVGGGSLGYANVLMKPTDDLFENPLWKHLADWKRVLEPYYEIADRMLGTTVNTRLWHADQVLTKISNNLGMQLTMQPTAVGVFLGKPGEEGKEVPDPYFGGKGPVRTSCTHCGGCMVGCRYDAKNTLMKNYLYFAEKWGAKISAENEAIDIQPLDPGQKDGARYEVMYRCTTDWIKKKIGKVRTKNVVLSAGSLGTLWLLFRCRDITRSLPSISSKLGTMVRTNSESLLGSSARHTDVNYSEGIAITSIFYANEKTTVEPVRYPAGSSLMRFLSSPLLRTNGNIWIRLFETLIKIVFHPIDFLKSHILPGWAQRTTILLIMQTEDNRIHMHLGRSFWSFFKERLVSHPDSKMSIPTSILIGHEVTRQFAKITNGIPAGSVNEGILNIPMTAHIMGGIPFGVDDQEGVIDLDCQIHNYPGIMVVDGSIVPGNPGINPSLTITALAEYAMSRVPPKNGRGVIEQIGYKPIDDHLELFL